MRANRVPFLAIVLLAACSPSGNTNAQTANLPAPTRTVPTSAAAMRQSFAPVVKKAAPAVVNISSKRLVRAQVDPFWEMFGLGAPRNRVEGSLGSGVIVRSDGVIVTNNHVVEGGQQITVALADRREFPAKVLLADPRTDLAVLKIEVPEKLPTLAINDSGDTQVGDLVLAIGDPFGVGQTVTNGIVSAMNRTADPSGDAASAYIQTDAAINPGNSGGALVDMNGDLIGINSFILSQSGTSSGVGFAIPGALVRRVVETAVGGGHTLVRPWFGARLQSVTPDMARSLGLATPSGALVADVWPGGPADRAGIKQGDVIVSVEGQPVVDAASVNYAVGTHRPGEPLGIGLRREGRTQTVTVRAEAAPATPARDTTTIGGRSPFTGATVENLSPAVAEQLGIETFANGVIVSRVAGGPAAAVGLQPGDIVRAVNGRRIATVRDLVAASSVPAEAWQVTIERGGQQITATFQ